VDCGEGPRGGACDAAGFVAGARACLAGAVRYGVNLCAIRLTSLPLALHSIAEPAMAGPCPPGGDTSADRPGTDPLGGSARGAAAARQVAPPSPRAGGLARVTMAVGLRGSARPGDARLPGPGRRHPRSGQETEQHL